MVSDTDDLIQIFLSTLSGDGPPSPTDVVLTGGLQGGRLANVPFPGPLSLTYDASPRRGMSSHG